MAQNNVKNNDPRGLLRRLSMAVDHDGCGVNLSREDTRLLRSFIVGLYGAIEESVGAGTYNQVCEDVAQKETRIRSREEA